MCRVKNLAKKLTRSALVTYTPEQMFDLVNDISRYPEFIPNCIRAKVIAETDQQLDAELTLNKAGVEHTFSTRNTITRPSQMTLHLLSGPFRQFDGRWQFSEIKQGCKVTFELTFEFSSMLLNLTAGKWMESLASQQVDVMCERAKALYG